MGSIKTLLVVFLYTGFNVILWAQNNAPDMNFVQLAEKGGIVGVLAYLSWSLSKRIKEMNKSFQDEEKEIRKEHREDITRLVDSISDLTKAIVNKQLEDIAKIAASKAVALSQQNNKNNQ